MTSQSLFNQARRRFLQQSLLGLVAMPYLLQAAGRQNKATNGVNVVVIGAGIAGLAAAQTLQAQGHSVTVLEGRERVGGRIWSDRSLGAAMDLGASWIHGPDGGNPITNLANLANATRFVTNDESVEVFDKTGDSYSDNVTDAAYEKYTELLSQIDELASQLNNDASVSSVISQIDASQLSDLLMQYQLSAFAEFDGGGPIENMSAKTWDGDDNFPGKDVLFPNGYDAITDLLAAGLDIRTNIAVSAIDYSGTGVAIVTNKGNFSADYTVVTVPLGVLKKGSISFTPALPTSKQAAIDKVSMGGINKVALLFDQAFWDINTQYFGYAGETKGQYQYFLNARTFSSANALMTFGFGNYGLTMEDQTDAQIQADIMSILRQMFGESAPEPTKILVTRWSSDPFAYGAYSYGNVGTTIADFDAMGGSVNNKLFFAGEHTYGLYRGTVHGAYLSGIREANRISALAGSANTPYYNAVTRSLHLPVVDASEIGVFEVELHLDSTSPDLLFSLRSAKPSSDAVNNNTPSYTASSKTLNVPSLTFVSGSSQVKYQAILMQIETGQFKVTSLVIAG